MTKPKEIAIPPRLPETPWTQDQLAYDVHRVIADHADVSLATAQGRLDMTELLVAMLRRKYGQ